MHLSNKLLQLQLLPTTTYEPCQQHVKPRYIYYATHPCHVHTLSITGYQVLFNAKYPLQYTLL